VRKVSVGLSLLEVLLTIGLISIVLILTSGLIVGYGQSTRAIQKSTNMLSVLHAISDSIGSELKGAARVSSPTGPSNTASVLTLQRVDPGVLDRLSFIVPGSPSGTLPEWTPYDYPDTTAVDDFLAEVTYQLQGTRLERTVKLAKSSVPEPPTLIANDIQSFEVEWLSDDSLEIRVVVDSQGTPKTLASKVYRRVR
jgi:type II secretory pathway component PulJ